jgi:hypothetical protein
MDSIKRIATRGKVSMAVITPNDCAINSSSVIFLFPLSHEVIP